jgi:hypothetical protein
MRHKRIAVVAIAGLLLLAGVVLVLPRLVDVNQYRGRIEAELQTRLDRAVMLGEMRLSLLPFGVRVEDASLGEDPRFDTQRPFAQADELYVSLRLWPLLRGEVELRSVELRRPVIELVRNAAGTWNFASLGGERDAAGPDADTTRPFVLQRLVVTNGQVAITDHQNQSRRSVYQNIDAELNDYAPDRAFRFLLAATLPGEGTQRLSVRGTAGPVHADDIARTPFDGDVRLEQVSLSALQRFLEVEALEGTDAVISGSAGMRNQEGLVSSSGSLRLDQVRARGVDVGYPITADYDLTHDLGAEVLTIAKGTLLLDRTPVSLTGTVNLQPETPTLDAHVTADDASLAEVARLASAFGVAFGTGTRVEGRLHADVRASGPVDRPALVGTLRLQGVSISGTDIPQPVRSEIVELGLTADEIRSNEFAAVTGNTSLAVRVSATGYTSPTPAIDAGIRTTNADLGEVLNIARAWGVDAVEGVGGSGRLTLDVRARGPVDDLTFSGSGSLTQASLTAPAVITQPLRIDNASLSFSRDAAVLDDLRASIGGTNAQGSLTVRNFAAPRVEFTLSADRVDVVEMQGLLVKGESAGPREEPQADDGALLRTTGSGTVRVGAIAYEQFVLNDVQSTITLDRGLIRLDPLAAGLFGGRYRGSIVMDARSTPPVVTVASNLEQVDANQLASTVTNLRDVIFGSLMSSADVRFVADGTDTIARSLNGKVSLNLAEGRIANVDLTQEVGNIARFATGRERAERSTSVARLNGTLDIVDGVARTDDLTAAIEGGTMAASGTINLVDQTLDLRLVTVFSREFSERVGGTRVGGFMTTALANQQGELVVPLLVTGTTQQPRFAPDVQRIAEMRLQNLVPNLRDPRALTGRILGGADGPEDASRDPRRTLGGIVDALTGRGGAQAQPEAPGEAGQPEDEAKPEATPQQAAPPPERRDPAQQVQDALRGLLRGRTQEEAKPEADEPPPPGRD